MSIEHLISNIDSSAYWRAEKAKQYPDDNRNSRCSEALSKLVERLSALPADDKHVVAYEAAIERLVELEAVDDVSGDEAKYIGRYGFDYPQDGDPIAFLQDLTEAHQNRIKAAEEQHAEEEAEVAYEAAFEAADEEAKEAADEAAKEAAEEAAKEAAEEAYKEAYDEAYKEAYDEAYKEALIDALQTR
jgi:flagellar biosynthesis/type III secretory pathway protein FliH